MLWGSEWVFSLPCSPRPPCPIKVRGRRRRGPQEAPAPLAFTSSLSLSLFPAFLQSLSRMTSRPVLLRTTQYVPVGEPHCVAYCTHCVAYCTPVPSWPWRMWHCETRAAARGAAPPRIGSHDVCMCACFCLCAWWAADPALETKPQLLLKSRAGSASPSRRGGLELRSDFWIETISDLPGPRIYVVSCTHAREPAGRCMRLFLHA